MPRFSLHAIVFSQRSLVRELLAELLRIRCAARIVARLGSLEDCAAPLPAAGVLVCDVNGLPTGPLDAFLERLRAENPQLRVVTIDDSLGNCSIDDIVSAVHNDARPAPASHEQLTPLESEVLLAVAAGMRNADIAQHMRRSCKTVEKHRANLLRKLGLRNVAQLTAYAIRNDLLHADAILARRSA